MRKYYIDNIRTVTILLVVLYHVIYMFNSIVTDGVIGPIAAAPALDAVQYVLYPWFMMILFLLSGMCSRYYLEKHTVQEYVRARTRKLLVPSTIGVLVTGWSLGYMNMRIAHTTALLSEPIPGVIRYLILCVSGIGVLWTIQVMWVLSMLLVVLRRLERGRLERLGAKAGMPALLLLGLLVYASAQVLNTPVIAVYRFGVYGMVFLLGYYVFSQERIIGLLERYAIWLIAGALVAGVVYVVREFGVNYATMPHVGSPLAITYGWLMCLAVLGGMKRFADRGTLRWLKERSFGIYVFHYLPLAVCAVLLTNETQLPAVWIYLLTTVAAMGGALLLNAVISRIPVLRWCVLGIKKR